MEKTAAEMRWNFETPLEGVEDGTALADIDVFRVRVPRETTNIPPRPPNGGDTLPWMGVRVAAGGD